jgi:hypothetical protein
MRPSSRGTNGGGIDFDWSAVKTFINTCKGFIGASSFELPWAISQAGLSGGFVGLIFFAFIGTYGMLLIVKCAFLLEQQTVTYPDLGREFGPVGRILVWVCFVFVYVGAGGSYFVFITKAMSDLTISYNPDLTPDVWTVLVLPLVVGLSFIRQYSLLAGTSMLGLSAAIIAIVFTTYDAAASRTIAPLSTYPQLRVETFPLFMGNAAFLYLLPTVVLPLHQSMCAMDRTVQGGPRTKKQDKKQYDTLNDDDSASEGRIVTRSEDEEEEEAGNSQARWGVAETDSSHSLNGGSAVAPEEEGEEHGSTYKTQQLQRFERIFYASVIFVSCINLPFAIFTYLCYADDTKDNVIDNLRPGLVTDAVKLLLCVDLLFTGVLFLFPLSEGLDREFFTDEQLGIAPQQQPQPPPPGQQQHSSGSGYGTSPRGTGNSGSSDSSTGGDGSAALHALAPKEGGGGGWVVECQRNMIRTVLVLMTAVVSRAIPFFSLITGLSGSIGNNLLGLIVPPLVYIKLQHGKHYWDPVYSLFPFLPCADPAHPSASPSPLPSEDGEEESAPAQGQRSRQLTTAAAWWRLADLMMAMATIVFGFYFLIVCSVKYAEELDSRFEALEQGKAVEEKDEGTVLGPG